MKILWLCNILLPEFSEVISFKPIPTGGWLTGLYNGILDSNSNCQFVFVCPYSKKDVFDYKRTKIYTYTHKEEKDVDFFKHILLRENPDIIHIHGTEFIHSYSMALAAKQLDLLPKTVVSLQGILFFYEKHFFASLEFKEIYGFSLRDLLKLDNVFFQRKRYRKIGIYEKQTLLTCSNVIGRTTWDFACSKYLNPVVRYFKANEILRKAFYFGQWCLEKCNRYSIFVTQSNYSIKGFHYLIKALPIIKKAFPEVHVFTTGRSILEPSFKERIKEKKYTKYLRRLIIRNHLEDNVTFLGTLTEEEVKNNLLSSHVFVLPSAIENSPNSLGEAMILGVPCVAANVGGIPDLLTDKVDGILYQYDADYMLAHYIIELFGNDELCVELSSNARKHAQETHSIATNVKSVLDIYSEIINGRNA